MSKIIDKIATDIQYGEKWANADIYITSNDLTPTFSLNLIRALDLKITGRDRRVATLSTVNGYLEDSPVLTDNKMGTFDLNKHRIFLQPNAVPS